MNKYEQRSARESKSTLRFAVMVMTALTAMAVLGLSLLGIFGSAPPRFWPKVGIGLAVAVLVLRQLRRALGKTNPEAVRPDPQSQLKLD